ncbi:MAG TPA: DUF3800 domain-containing protein, partial [Actinoplanes sp.]|nr:DUF3800 domain-containing protein [Actinoplanes sp.]
PAAEALYRAAHPTGQPWILFLTTFENLARTRHHRPAAPSLDRFLQARDRLLEALTTGPAASSNRATAEQPVPARRTDPPGAMPNLMTDSASAVRDRVTEQAVAVLNRLTRPRVAAVQARLDSDDREIPPPLEPMLPALAETILLWGDAGRRRVLVVHDEQSALTADRLTRLGRALADPTTGRSPLAGLVMADSRDDPRIQVADLLAGTARRRPALLPTALRSPTSLTWS